MRVRMPCQTPGALRTSSWVCLARGGIAKRTMVPATAINANISRITLTKRGTWRFCSHTTIGLRTMAREKRARTVKLQAEGRAEQTTGGPKEKQARRFD